VRANGFSGLNGLVCRSLGKKSKVKYKLCLGYISSICEAASSQLIITYFGKLGGFTGVIKSAMFHNDLSRGFRLTGA
jgi:hypothetical protein